MEREYGSYEQQIEYPSYQTDYKPSYGKDNYKSKDSVSIKKLNCINSNFNTNGDINGDINIFSPSRTATDSDEGDLGTGNNGEGDWGYGNDGYQQNKKDKDFSCIINSNNNINGGEEPVPLTCEECFTELSEPELQRVLDLLSVTTIEDACTALGTITQEFIEAVLSESIAVGTPTPEQILRINEIIECLL